MADTFSNAIKEDGKFKRLTKMLRAGAYAIDTSTLLSEIQTMHSTRKIRNLKYSEIVQDQQKIILEAVLQNQAYRSRCAEIKSQCNRISMSLANHADKLSKYLKIKYKSQMAASSYKTITAQKEAVQNALSPAYTQIREIEAVEKACDILIEDIDKAAFMINQVLKVFEVNTRPERNI